MDGRQAIIKGKIAAVVTASQSDEITYKSEWLGYLPFGVYCWVEHQGLDFAKDFPAGWTLDNLTSLEHAGFLEIIDTYSNPDDEFDRHIRYRVGGPDHSRFT